MKIKNVFLLALKRLIINKKRYLKFLFSFVTIYSLFFALLFFGFALNNEYIDISNNRSKDNYVNIYKEQISINDVNKIIDYHNVDDFIIEYVSYFYISEEFSDEEEIFTVYLDNEAIKNDDLFYLDVGAFQNVNNGYYLECLLEDKISANSIIVAGKNITNNNEALVSTYIISFLGYPNIEDAEANLLNRQLVIRNSHNEVIFDKIIVGIMSSIAYQYDIHQSIITFDELSEINVLKVHLSSYYGNDELFSYLETISELSYHYIGASNVEMMSIIESQQQFLLEFFFSVILIVLIVMLLYIGSNQYFMLKRNTYFYGLIKAQGASNKELFFIHFIEIFILSLISLIVSFIISYLFYLLISVYFSSIYTITLRTYFNQVLLSTAVVFGISIALSLLLALTLYRLILKQKPIDLIKTR